TPKRFDFTDDFHVQKAAFSPDRKILILVDHGSQARLVDASTGKRLVHFRKDQGILSIAVSHDGKTMATGGQDNVIRLYDTSTGKEIRQVGGEGQQPASYRGSLKGWVYCVEFAPNDRLLASATRDGLRLWDLTKGKVLFEVPTGYSQAAFSPDGKVLAASKLG